MEICDFDRETDINYQKSTNKFLSPRFILNFGYFLERIGRERTSKSNYSNVNKEKVREQRRGECREKQRPKSEKGRARGRAGGWKTRKNKQHRSNTHLHLSPLKERQKEKGCFRIPRPKSYRKQPFLLCNFLSGSFLDRQMQLTSALNGERCFKMLRLRVKDLHTKK